MTFFQLPMRDSVLARRVRFGARVSGLLAASFLAGCQLDSVVQATDPDIIDPSFVQSSTGADGVRVGTLGRFNANTTGGESMFLYGGLMADEFTTGDTFTQRIETDQRSLTPENGNVQTAYRGIHLVRIGSQQARELLRRYPLPAGQLEWRLAEMYFTEAYMINMLAEHFCNGQPLSSIEGFVEQPSARIPTDSLYLIAQAKIDSGTTLIGTLATANDVRVRSALQILRARIALNQGNFALASTAAAAVPTTYAWEQEHNLNVRTPGVWSLVNNQRRYIVSNNEGPLAMGFANATQDPRVPTCQPGTGGFNAAACGTTFSTTRPFDSGNTAVPNMRYQLIWDTDARNVALVSGLQARLYEAEAQNRQGNFATPTTGALAILNSLRATPPTYVLPGRTVTGLTPLADPATADARRDLVFREKGFWLFGTGHRFGDLRRMQRQYSMTQTQVWPNGVWQINRVPGYGTDVTFPTPQAEANNRLVPQSTPGIPACIDRNP
jgi:starch-binding outer membrane protein, SusD/RagB family